MLRSLPRIIPNMRAFSQFIPHKYSMHSMPALRRYGTNQIIIISMQKEINAIH